MKKDLFRTDIARGLKASDVDREKNIIHGFAVVTKGVTKDARGEFDDDAIERIVAFGNEAAMGIKSRFGHPNMSSTALGTFLGRAKNFRRDGDIVRADLHIDKTALNTPDGNLAGYVMDLAESDPEMFGASMVIYWDEEKREELGEDGKELPPFIRVTKLLSVDVVDDPAANNGLFGMPFFTDSVKPSAEMSAFLDTFLSHPEAVNRVIGFLHKYANNHDAINHDKEAKTMFEDLTVETIKEKRQDIFNAIREEGKAEGIKSEKERSLSILKKAESFQEMGELAFRAIENGSTVDQALISFQDKRLTDLESVSVPTVGPDGEEEPKKKLSHLDRARGYQKEHGCSMTDALKATAEKRKEA